MTKDDCDILDAQLKEAEISGLALLVKKDTKNKNRFDDAYGQRMIDQYAAKLKEGRDALAAREGRGRRYVPLKPPPGNASVRPEATRRTRRRSTPRSRRSTRRLTTRATRRRTRREESARPTTSSLSASRR